MWMLEKFLGKSLPRPVNVKKTSWLSNRNFLGAYSYLSMSTEKNKVTPADLGRSISAGRRPLILFAGEATDEKFSSYAHGAVASGWRAGDELAAYINGV